MQIEESWKKVLCVSPGNYNVRVGTTLNSEGGWEVEIAEIIVHEKYRSLIYDYDATLLRLEEPLQFSEVVQPVTLAEEGDEFSAGTPAVATGWGTMVENGLTALILQEVELPLLDNAACKKYYPLRITARMICAGYAEGGRDACQGDSGGPLVVSGGRQVGIVSWGRGCARSASPGVYARVAALRDWIAQKSGV
ncbi:hypothetical protein R5R35_006048 [Gryllus longicercus]|uniref:Peptidase S1 domain-containing protein n=1 Tax=Gryllus longicercus TaxID=2509291 RepID=A0AAN9VR53_9ORTH